MIKLSIPKAVVFDTAFGQELCDILAEAMGHHCFFADKSGKIIAASLRIRIGTVHVAAKRVMTGEFSEYAIDPTEALASNGLMREGVVLGIDCYGERVICQGISGPAETVVPLARVVAFCVRSILQARQIERETVARLAQSTLDASEKLLEDMRMRASTDFLTGTCNRTFFINAAENERQRLIRYGYPVSMIFADIDHFKSVNDTHGHNVGDRVLQGVCEVIRSCVRNLDMLGRWGGEEFVVLLPNTDQETAGMLALRIREQLHTQDFSPVKRVTASFGIAECQIGENFEGWLSRADAAMYKAKNEGRDQVVLAEQQKTKSFFQEHQDAGLVRLVWNKRFECGHTSIDQAHKNLFDLSNRIISSLAERDPTEHLNEMLVDLLDKISVHFSEEETIIESIGYKHADWHRQIHLKLLTELTNKLGDFRANKIDIYDLITFISVEIILKHMAKEDVKFFGKIKNAE